MKKYILIIIVVIVFGLIWFYQNSRSEIIKIELPAAQKFDDFSDKNFEAAPVDNNLPENTEFTETSKPKEELVEPKIIVQEVTSVNLAVPFTSQAPTANWDEPFQDACEEASILMVAYYYQNKKMPLALEVEDILKNMINWQIESTGDTHNMTVQETSLLVQEFFDYRTEIVLQLTAEKIREILKTGTPVIVPADGHILDNPYFSGDGPDYHMLVIKGFVDDKFITNDPGTKRGEDFIYTEENLMAATADWDSKKARAVGPKVALVLYKD